jgi:CRISPR type III-A-associated RAMP protein Csm4
MPLIEVRLRPTAPWRVGAGSGDRERTGAIYRSDALYSAVTHAMNALGWMEEWLEVTARSADDVAVRFSSLFPFFGGTRLAPPPRTQGAAARTQAQNARFVPLEFARGAALDEAQWSIDANSGCMIPAGAPAPFTTTVRSFAAIDRLTGAAEPHRAACTEFAPGAGWWGLIDVSAEPWESRVKSALRFLADSGFGAGRARGWGRAAEPEFQPADDLRAAPSNGSHIRRDAAWWLLSLYSPHENDAVDWSRGDYVAETRGGWVESPAGHARKKQARFIAEGSVMAAPGLRGRAVDVAPEGFPHPVWRAGFALALPVGLEAEA